MDMETMRSKYAVLSGALTERSRRLWAATEAMSLGHGGIALVERATGISRSTITRGIREVESGASGELPPERTRRAGGGRKRATEKDPTLIADLDALVEPMTLGDPDSPLRWTSKSVRHLADELTAMGHLASYQLVARLLKESGYSLQANRKTREGSHHDDRDAQFRYINQQVRLHFARGDPAISVDTKKKELVGDFKNRGREWRPKGMPESVRVHDFLIPDLGKAIPYGVYDLSRDEGLGERGHRPRHGQLRGQRGTSVVEGHGQVCLPGRRLALDHRRRRRKQRSSGPTLEVGTPEVRQQVRALNHRLSLPPGHQQVE